MALCPAYESKRLKITEEIGKLCLTGKSEINLEEIMKNPNILTQFILDPSSFNLKSRVNISEPILGPLFKLSRDLCNRIHSERLKKLKEIKTVQDSAR